MKKNTTKRIDSLGRDFKNGYKVILQTVVHEDSKEYVVRVEHGYVLHSETECDDDYQQARVVFDAEVLAMIDAITWHMD